MEIAARVSSIAFSLWRRCYRKTMSVGTLVTLEEYLNTAYSPDREYVDGVVVERNVGERPHGSYKPGLPYLFPGAYRRFLFGANCEHAPSRPGAVFPTSALPCTIPVPMYWKSRPLWLSKSFHGATRWAKSWKSSKNTPRSESPTSGCSIHVARRPIPSPAMRSRKSPRLSYPPLPPPLKSPSKSSSAAFSHLPRVLS